MKVTIEIDDSWLADLQKIMAETKTERIDEFFKKAACFYFYVFRQVDNGLRLALLDRRHDIVGKLIGKRLFCKLFHQEKEDAVSSAN